MCPQLFFSPLIPLPAGHINLLSVHQICGVYPPPRVCCALSWNSIHQIKNRFSVACRAQLTLRQACCIGSVGSSLPTSIASECLCLILLQGLFILRNYFIYSLDYRLSVPQKQQLLLFTELMIV